MKSFNFVKITSLFLFASSTILAQMPLVTAPAEEVVAEDDFTWQYVLLFMFAIGLIGAIYWSLKRRKAKKNDGYKKRLTEGEGAWEHTSLDADKELEWLRRNKNIVNKRGKYHRSGKKLPTIPGVAEGFPQMEFAQPEVAPVEPEKPQRSGQMPIFSIKRLELSRHFIPLSLSNDEALMSAIEQVHEEYEEDEEVRDLALRILAAFKTRNSIEALSQIALYDLSSSLRSRAVGVLTDFDHESVFEPILLACADPTREVRAAAARGLFRLSFDRADAWTRIAETKDEFKMRASARAAIEADLVKRSLERLVHHDSKSAYEAFALVALLLKADETAELLEALQSHRDANVQKAILHVMRVTKEPSAIDGLYTLLERNSLSDELQKEVDEVLQEIGLVAA